AGSQRLPYQRNETGPQVQRMVAELSDRLSRTCSPRDSSGSRRTPERPKVYGSRGAIGRCQRLSINRKELGLQPLGRAGRFASWAGVSCWHPPHTSKRHLLIRGSVEPASSHVTPVSFAVGPFARVCATIWSRRNEVHRALSSVRDGDMGNCLLLASHQHLECRNVRANFPSRAMDCAVSARNAESSESCSPCCRSRGRTAVVGC